MIRDFNPAPEHASREHHLDDGQIIEPVPYDFGLRRRTFVQLLGLGVLVAAAPAQSFGQSRGGGRGGAQARPVSSRVLLGKDGSLTVLTGKVECGQGARAQLTQAAAEELRVPAQAVRLIMADTSMVPDDGMTVGSRTTPSTVPAVRQGAAAARELLVEFAAAKWSVERSEITVREGKAVHSPSGRSVAYADLANDADAAKWLEQSIPADTRLTSQSDWTVLGKSVPNPEARRIVTGAHLYPSDIHRGGMLYGMILRPSTYGARLLSLDPNPARALGNVTVVHDGQFAGVTAPSSHLAGKAIALLAQTARWEPAPHPSSSGIFEYLRDNSDGIPANPFAEEATRAHARLKQEYRVAFAQHAPLEPRAAVAEWTDGSLTVWTATQRPEGVRTELAQAFRIGSDRVRVVVPDFGGGFGGKHTGECAVEAARLARAASKPVSVRWTREEEFTWAAFRPAALISIEAGLDDKGALTSWHFVDVNAGNAGMETPYRIARSRSQFVRANSPLRHGSYRALAATANNFGRECFMDELAASAGRDPLEFRLAHLENPRLRAVLEAAARRFNWSERSKNKTPNRGVGLACGTEKGSFVAACVEVEIQEKNIRVRDVCETFECGAILNPVNLRAQVLGAIIMGLGPALSEEVRFEGGEILTTSFRSYRVPRFADVPPIDIELIDRPNLPIAGAGETPIIAVAPAIANAVFHATGQRIRTMPIRL